MTCIIGNFNRIDSATLTTGSWETTLPLNNLKTRILGQVARTTSAAEASSTFRMDLTTERRIQVVSLVNHNISLDGLIRIRASDDNHATYFYDSGNITVWPAVYSAEDLEWEDSSWWSGTYTDEEITGYTTNIVHILESIVYARYWRIDILDSTNAAGYIQLGRVFIGSTWTPERDAEVGLSLGWETTTQVQKALNGTKYYQRKNPYRVTRFTLNVMDVGESLSAAFEIDRRTGIDGEVLWIQDDQDTLHALRRRYLGTIREMTPIEYPYANFGRKQYTIEEIV